MNKNSILAFTRNGILGQICMTRGHLNRLVYHTDPRLIAKEDIRELTSALARLNIIVSRWDKHYIKNHQGKNDD